MTVCVSSNRSVPPEFASYRRKRTAAEPSVWPGMLPVKAKTCELGCCADAAEAPPNITTQHRNAVQNVTGVNRGWTRVSMVVSSSARAGLSANLARGRHFPTDTYQCQINVRCAGR
jgi:hypothetical protein